MKIAYFDCANGISGDMFLGALVDAGLPVEKLSAAIESLGIDGLCIEAERVKRKGISATKVHVIVPHEHKHRHLKDIEEIINAGALPDRVKTTAKAIFRRVAEAESHVHDEPIEKVHFHEVGALDSIADIVGAAAGIDLLGIEECRFSRVSVGSGTVKAAHGVLPVPAPATAEILQGVPIGPGVEKSELTTPTGAAIAKELAVEFGVVPEMTVSAVGSGAGSRDGEVAPNVLRVFIGEAAGSETPGTVTVIEASIDDMTGEALSYAAESLFDAGALDVYMTPIFMKKGRPAHLLTVIVDAAHRDRVVERLFAETSTFGARVSETRRETLDRETVEVESEYGTFRAKVGRHRDRATSAAPEFEDAGRIAKETGEPFRKVYGTLQAAASALLDWSDKPAEIEK
jgi:uncharacterized protein (TIGR00299 family) protein